jgi:hypothetical protein
MEDYTITINVLLYDKKVEKKGIFNMMMSQFAERQIGASTCVGTINDWDVCVNVCVCMLPLVGLVCCQFSVSFAYDRYYQHRKVLCCVPEVFEYHCTKHGGNSRRYVMR